MKMKVAKRKTFWVITEEEEEEEEEELDEK